MLDQAVWCNAFVCTSQYVFGLANIALGTTGFAPLRCDLSVLLKLLAASPHRLRTPARSDSQQEQLQRGNHEPVCLVPVCGPVPAYAWLHSSEELVTHSESFSLC